MLSMGIFESLQPIFYAERRIWEILSEKNSIEQLPMMWVAFLNFFK